MNTPLHASDGTSRYVRFVRIAIFLFVAMMCFYRLGDPPLRETDEGFAANRAASIARHHSSVLLTYDDVDGDEPQFHKPPLLYWTVAGLYRVLGHNLWAVRLPTATMAFVLCVLLYLITRRHLGEWCGLWSAVLPCTVPFVLEHIRTAMLDLPMLCFGLLAVWLFSYSDRWRRAILAGLVAGGAVMVKGAAGLLSVYMTLAYGLVERKINSKFAKQALVVIVLALLPAAIFMLAVPPEWRSELCRKFLVDETVDRLAPEHISRWFQSLVLPLLYNLRWHVPAALLGLVPLFAMAREKAVRQWILLLVVVSVPVIVVANNEVVPYPRYFLPLYPFLLTLSALFCREATRTRAASLMLPSFAIASAFVEQGAMRWIPVLVSLIVFYCMQSPEFRERAWLTRVMAFALMVSVAWPSYESATARAMVFRDNRWYRPEVEALARRAADLVPPGDKLVVGSGFKLHNVLFYSDRSVESFRHWLQTSFAPGQTRYGIFCTDEVDVVPHVRVTLVDHIDNWRLVKMETDGDASIRGIMVSSSRRTDRIAESLNLLGVQYTTFPRGFILTNLPSVTLSDLGMPLAGVKGARLDVGQQHTVDVTRVVSLGAVDLIPSDRAQPVGGLRLEALDADSGAWKLLREWWTIPDLGLSVQDGHIAQDIGRAVRIQFEPVKTSKVRLTRTSGPIVKFADIKLFVTDGAGDGKK